MAIANLTMTDEQRKSVALEYLKAFDNKGVTSSGGSILDLFADDAQVFFPKWGLATGKQQIGQLFTDFGGNIKSIRIARSVIVVRSYPATQIVRQIDAIRSIRAVSPSVHWPWLMLIGGARRTTCLAVRFSTIPRSSPRSTN